MNEYQKFEHDIAVFANSKSTVQNSDTALRYALRMPKKPKKTIVTAPPQPPTEMVTDFAPPMVLPQTSIVIAKPPTRPKRKAATKVTEALQPS